MKVKLSQIAPSPDNAAGRSEMNEAMEELIATIKAQGVVDGISVRPNGKGYEIIDGERRWFAAKKAGVKEVDVIIHEVDSEKARLMRLSALAHEDWPYEEFAEKIWRELERPDIGTITELARITGMDKKSLGNAQGFHLAKLEGCVVVIDGEVQAHSTSIIGNILKKVDLPLRKAVAKKASEEKVHAKKVQYLCSRVKKALPNEVAFGEPDDKDYETHNFEVAAILRIPWDTEEFETEVKYMAEGMEEAEHKRWEAARFNKKAMKEFTDSLIAWKKAIKQVERTKHQFSPDAAQFCVNALAEIRELEDSITTFFIEKEKELPK